MAEPGDEIAAAAAGRGHLRASHADREQVIDTLKLIFVQGRLTKDEFDARIGQTFASRTYAELAAATAAIPAGLASAQPLRKPVRALTRAEKTAAWGVYGIIMPAFLTVAGIPGRTTVGAVAVTAAVIYFIFWLLGGVMMLGSRHGWPRPYVEPRPPCRSSRAISAPLVAVADGQPRPRTVNQTGRSGYVAGQN
jgi:Domain of unknown function (DUF1707)